MPNYSKENQRYHQNRIRAVLVINPQASLREIKESLENSKTSPLPLHIDYLAKLRKKIDGERTNRHAGSGIAARISALQDKIHKINEQLWQIAASGTSGSRDKTAALKALAENDLKLLQAEMDAGIYDRKIGTVEIEARRNQPIDEEHQKKIEQAFEAWGFIQPEPKTIEIKQENDPAQSNLQALPGGTPKSS
jgi:hypothetical protein